MSWPNTTPAAGPAGPAGRAGPSGPAGAPGPDIILARAEIAWDAIGMTWSFVSSEGFTGSISGTQFSCVLTLLSAAPGALWFLTAITAASANSQGPNESVIAFDGTTAGVCSFAAALATSCNFYVMVVQGPT